MKLLLKGGRVINPATAYDEIADVLIEDGIIKEIGSHIAVDNAEIYEAEGLIVTPGLVDIHVHLREPGLEAKEDIVSGTQAAAAGGFTTVACMPNTRPIIDNSILVAGLKHRAQTEGIVNVEIIGAMSKSQEGKELAEIGDMLLNGAVAISDDGHFVNNARLFRAGLEYANIFGKRIISHAEDENLSSEGVMHEGAVSTRLGLVGNPSVSEDIAVSRDVMLAEYTNSLLHVAHVSSKNAVDIIRQAKKRGVNVTTEATVHHLTLTDDAVIGYNTATKVNPPLRSQDHVDALLAGLLDGTIDAIVTDHAPHAYEEKDVEYRYAPSGFTGLETALGVILTELVHTGKIGLMQVIEKMTYGPAKVLGLNAGCLKVGGKADITIVNPGQEWTVDSRTFYTRGKHTPYEGKKLKGRAVATIVGGKFVMKNGEVFA